MTYRLDEQTGITKWVEDEVGPGQHRAQVSVHGANVVRAGDTILVTVDDPNTPLDQLTRAKASLEAGLPKDVKVHMVVGGQVTIVRAERDGTIGGATP